MLCPRMLPTPRGHLLFCGSVDSALVGREDDEPSPDNHVAIPFRTYKLGAHFLYIKMMLHCFAFALALCHGSLDGSLFVWIVQAFVSVWYLSSEALQHFWCLPALSGGTSRVSVAVSSRPNSV